MSVCQCVPLTPHPAPPLPLYLTLQKAPPLPQAGVVSHVTSRSSISSSHSSLYYNFRIVSTRAIMDSILYTINMTFVRYNFVLMLLSNSEIHRSVIELVSHYWQTRLAERPGPTWTNVGHKVQTAPRLGHRLPRPVLCECDGQFLSLWFRFQSVLPYLSESPSFTSENKTRTRSVIIPIIVSVELQLFTRTVRRIKHIQNK